MTVALIGFQQAKDQIHETGTLHDADIDLKILQASAIVLDYINESPDDWEVVAGSSPEETIVPDWAQVATLAVFAELFANRESTLVNPMSDGVKAMLAMHHDPAFA